MIMLFMKKNELCSVLREKGWVYFKGFSNFYELAKGLGNPVPSRRGGNIIVELKILKRENAPPKSLSKLYGIGAFPFHIDGSHKRQIPKFLLMRLKCGTRSNRPTLIKDIQNNLEEREIKILKHDLWYVRDGRRTFLSPIYLNKKGRFAEIRYDPGCMEPANNIRNKSKKLMNEVLEKTKTETVNWQRNYWLLLDNTRVLHSRSKNMAEDEIENGILERILINEVSL